MDLMKEDYQLFDRDNYAFKQLKEIHTPDEVEQIKQEYKAHWQKWKEIQLQTAALLPDTYGMSKPKIESWTNGWNLRSHFWSAYRSESRQDENACLAVLLNQKQYQIYLMYQHYKSDTREGSVEGYNQLLSLLQERSTQVAIEEYYIWPQPENELEDHLPLSVYLSDKSKQEELRETMGNRTFQLGKLFFSPNEYTNIEEKTAEALKELAPLYHAIKNKL
ncbi:glucose-6-phosphate 1-dehydrogenase family protein [Enterococcus lactis]|uniref:glucose-6-phosphate 1-dehydrogenase family protein n=1 Tax=Enterococcus lactis TaxID=357441 RepID=UPI0020916C4F|nr:glucose-6-phosphate 1-dehydrogenase family protein [Enterococcus lactis]MCO5453905.1 glucose-6-phosphate 1-dehydrogenase family protein [Enterococcus lactis]